MSCCCKSFDLVQFIVGLCPTYPAEGDTEYINNNLKYSKYTVYKNGFGYLVEDLHYERLINGGFKLLEEHTFHNGETYTISNYA